MDDRRTFKFLCHSNKNNKRRKTKVEHLSLVESKCIKKHTPADLSGGLKLPFSSEGDEAGGGKNQIKRSGKWL
jgi:hypothetical protein